MKNCGGRNHWAASLFEPLSLSSFRALCIDVVHACDEVRHPCHLELRRANLQGRIAFQHTGEDHGGDGIAHITLAVAETHRILVVRIGSRSPPIRANVEAQGHAEILGGRPQRLVHR